MVVRRRDLLPLVDRADDIEFVREWPEAHSQTRVGHRGLPSMWAAFDNLPRRFLDSRDSRCLGRGEVDRAVGEDGGGERKMVGGLTCPRSRRNAALRDIVLHHDPDRFSRRKVVKPLG